MGLHSVRCCISMALVSIGIRPMGLHSVRCCISMALVSIGIRPMGLYSVRCCVSMALVSMTSIHFKWVNCRWEVDLHL